MSWLGSPDRSKTWHHYEDRRLEEIDYNYFKAKEDREPSEDKTLCYYNYLGRVKDGIMMYSRNRRTALVERVLEDAMHSDPSPAQAGPSSGSSPSSDSGNGSREEVGLHGTGGKMRSGARRTGNYRDKAKGKQARRRNDGQSKKEYLSTDWSSGSRVQERLSLLPQMYLTPPSYSSVTSIPEGSDSESEDEAKMEGPQPLESDDQAHVFFYHSTASQDIDLIEHYVSMLEGSPYEMKCMSVERDFKTELNHSQNLILAISLSQRVVVLLTEDFLSSNYDEIETVLGYLLTEAEKRQKVLILLESEAKVPKRLMDCKSFELIDEEWNEKLTRTLMAGPTSSKSSEPSAPPLETIGEENIMPDNDFSFPDPPRECAVYQNGQIVRHITATKYNEFEVRGDIEEGCCFGQEVFPCPSDMLCPASRRALEVPASLSRRGLQIPREDFEEILAALSDASKVRLFSFTKNVSLPCLYLLAMIIVGGLSIALWFLSVFCIKKYQTREEARISIFWAFMVGILFVPALMALAGLGLMIRTANKMYKKFKHTQAEFNKRFRELNLILHSKKSYWFCSGRLKLFFIYYNFEQCQQMLYRHVCAGMTLNGHVNIEENTHLLHAEGADHYENGNTATVRIDRIMRRVNSLVNRYEWEYFEKLINKKLPSVDKFEHRKRGICFCQFAQLRAREDAAKAASINVRAARHATGRIVTRIPISARIRNWTRTLLRRTHRDEPSIVTTHIGNGTSARMNGNGRTRNGSAAYFSQSEPGEVVFI